MENKREKILEIYKSIKEEIMTSGNSNDKLYSLIQDKSFIEQEDFEDGLKILSNMNKNQVINYNKILDKLIKQWTNNQKRPKILLHSCCAPCSTYTLEFMSKYADVTILFANSNIHPKSEYEKRARVQEEFILEFNKRTGNNVGFIEDEYNPKYFVELTKGEEHEPEGGKRCITCFQMRLDIVANYAKRMGFDYFGFEVQEIYDVKYLPSDFKKNNGYKRSIELCNEYDVYRQCYCGCIFALRDQLKQQKERENL